MSKLFAIPCTITEANEFVRSFHRHNRPTVGALFAVGCSDGDGLWGVAIIGRPVARMLQDGATVEVNRVCTREGAPLGSCSFLYAASWRAARALGYRRLLTYTLATESGASLRGAGWRQVATVEPHKGLGWASRARDWQSVYGQQKFRWEVAA